MKLGATEINRIGLGTNRLTDTDANRSLLTEALNAGVNFIDTAHLYAGGDSERTIGAALAPFPDGVIVATKGGYNDGRPETLRAEIEESLRRLHTDTIDLYYLHRVDSEVPLERSLEAINECREQGSIRHIGISAVDVSQIERARTVAPIAAVQNSYSLSEREHEPVVDYCEQHEIVFVPYYPLGGRGGVIGSSLSDVAAQRDATPSQIALAWLLKRSPAMVPIPGTLSPEHLRENLGALEIELSDEEFAMIGTRSS
jgi:aryl-alcohol dehydrogenase-like predicted oxidoreductase